MRVILLTMLLACDSAVPLAEGHADHEAMPADAAAEFPCGSEAMQWVVVRDLDPGLFPECESSWGTEVCWIEVICDGVRHLGVEAVLIPRDEPVEGDRRRDPTLALTLDEECFRTGNQEDEPVAVVLGYLGRLAVRFDTGRPCGLVGCQIQVAEAPSWTCERRTDIYTLSVCDAPQDGQCLYTSAGPIALRGTLGPYPPLEVDCCACWPGGPFRRPDGQGPDAHGAP